MQHMIRRTKPHLLPFLTIPHSPPPVASHSLVHYPFGSQLLYSLPATVNLVEGKVPDEFIERKSGHQTWVVISDT